jgi:hypothetical protein
LAPLARGIPLQRCNAGRKLKTGLCLTLKTLKKGPTKFYASEEASGGASGGALRGALRGPIVPPPVHHDRSQSLSS